MRRLFLIICCILIVFPAVSALSTTLQQNYKQSETAIARIDGSLTSSISSNQIEFKRGTVRVPLQFDIQNLGGTYYLWAIMPNTPGNYTIYIYNVATQDHQASFTYSQNFSVASSQADYSINPGAVLTSGNYNMDIVLNKDNSEQITTDFPGEQSITLLPGDNQISFSASNTAGMHTMNLGVYAVPVYLTTGTSQPVQTNLSVNNTTNSSLGEQNATNQNQTSQTGQNDTSTNQTSQSISNNSIRMLLIDQPALSKIAYFNSVPSYGFTISNTGNVAIDDIVFVYARDLISIKPKDSASLNANQSYQFNITFLQPLNTTVKTSLRITSSGGNITIPINIDMTKNASSVVNAYSAPSASNASGVDRTSTFYCSELSGKLCPENTACSGSNVSAHDGICCIGSCVVQPKNTGYGWVGWLIAGIVVLIIAYMWHKYKSVKPSENPILKDAVGPKRP